MFRRRLLTMMQQAQAIWRTVTRTGTGLIVADDTTEGMPLEIEMQGWTRQETTTGAQLFDKMKITEVKPGTACTAERTENETVKIQAIAERSGPYAVIKAPIALQANKTYYAIFRTVFASQGRTPRMAFFRKDQLGGFLAYNKYTPAANIEIELGLYMINAGEIGDIIEVDNIMLSEQENGDYEEYTGGQPSPNPDYLQEIEQEGIYNSEKQKYERTVKLFNSNLFDKTKLQKGSFVEFNGVECFKYKDGSANFDYLGEFAENTQYTIGIKFYREDAHKGKETNIVLLYTDGTKSNKNVNENELVSITSEPGKTIEKITGNWKYEQFVYIDLSVSRINAGSELKDYEPHQEQIVKITSDRAVSKWDRIELRDGVYGWVYKTREYTFDGTESWNADGTTKFFTRRVLKARGSDDGFCNALSYTIKGGDYSNYTWSGDGYFELFNVEGRATQEEIQQWIKDLKAKGTELIVIYEGEEEEFVPLPEKEQAMMRTLKTYFQTTVVANDDNMFMQIEYKTRIPEQEV